MRALAKAGAFVIPNPTEIGATTERMLASAGA